MAWVTVVCNTAEDLVCVYELLKQRLQVGDIRAVRNGFVDSYRWNGYRDVKVFVNLEEHICEIQLHVRSFYTLKDDQHKVYGWTSPVHAQYTLTSATTVVGFVAAIIGILYQQMHAFKVVIWVRLELFVPRVYLNDFAICAQKVAARNGPYL